MARRSGAYEIDVAALDVGVGELYAQRITDVRPFKPPHQPSFGNRLADAHPHSPVGSAGHQGVKLLADARFEQHGGGAEVRLESAREHRAPRDAPELVALVRAQRLGSMPVKYTSTSALSEPAC